MEFVGPELHLKLRGPKEPLSTLGSGSAVPLTDPPTTIPIVFLPELSFVQALSACNPISKAQISVPGVGEVERC